VFAGIAYYLILELVKPVLYCWL